MLKLSGLTIRAGTKILVQDLSLTLPTPGITALIGPSGCGKSSVLKWLAGITAKGLTAKGSLSIAGEELRQPDPRLGYQPQGDALFPWLTIVENAALGLEVAGYSRREALAKVAPLFPAFGLAGCETLYPAELSGGMRQRAAFLRSIAPERQFLLLDEPFSALDAVTRLRLQSWFLERLAERPSGVLLVTHDLHEATALADRVLVMAANPGRIIADLPVPIARNQRSEAALAALRETLRSLLLKEAP